MCSSFCFWFLIVSDYLLKLVCCQHLESIIKSRIPGITSLINRSIDELESELDHLGRPVAVDAGVGAFLCTHY